MRHNSFAVQQIVRRRRLSYADFMRQHCVPRRPVILTHAIGSWPATSRWTLEYLVERIGDEQVEVHGTTYTFRRLVELAAGSSPTSPAPYARVADVARLHPELSADLLPPTIFDQPNWSDSRLLLPALRRRRLPETVLGGCAVDLHELSDGDSGFHSFVCQLVGTNELVLHASAPPEQAQLGDPAPDRPDVEVVGTDGARSAADPGTHTVTLQPGETLFVPAGWWAAARTSAPSVAVMWGTVNGTNWADVAAGMHRRVLRTGGAPLAALFGLYARVVARAKIAAETVIADSSPEA